MPNKRPARRRVSGISSIDGGSLVRTPPGGPAVDFRRTATIENQQTANEVAREFDFVLSFDKNFRPSYK